ncbi:hypothetical protein KC19_9G160100 [Ceratodon purpureus]|uniref:Uncharacterized protein n=1 Tax=Ceratodon purpureus TaxID=3225 RepID=A0A8T0GUD3_CERPU|nr:hypothetical protein KC19_9G160100 [Ceratodon purpureus]
MLMSHQSQNCYSIPLWLWIHCWSLNLLPSFRALNNPQPSQTMAPHFSFDSARLFQIHISAGVTSPQLNLA